MGNSLSDSSITTITIFSFSIAIIFDALLLLLLVAMKRWNHFTIVMFSVALLDILTFFSELLYRVLFVTYSNPYTMISLYVLGMLPLLFLTLSVIASLITSYSVLYLLKYRKIFSYHSWIARSVIFTSILIPIVLMICMVVNYHSFVSRLKNNDDSEISYVDVFDAKNNGIAYVVFQRILMFYAAALIFANFAFFSLSLFYSNKIIVPLQYQRGESADAVGGGQTNSQSAISILVGRMIYYPIIQAFLFCIFYVKAGNADVYSDRRTVFLNLLFIIPTLASLILFLRMQPFAYDHLKDMLLWCCSLGRGESDRSSRAHNNNETGSDFQPYISDSNPTRSLLVDSQSTPSNYFEAMEHDDLVSMISRDESEYESEENDFFSVHSNNSQYKL